MYSEFTRTQIVKFVTQYGNDIIAGITDSGLFFAAVVAQLTVESKWGQYGDAKPASDLALKYNNWGGIKDSSAAGTGVVTLSTLEGVTGSQITSKERFATYPLGFTQFMQDYVRILKLSSYVGAGVYSAADPYQQLLAIGRGGYSTNTPDEYLKLGKGRIEACLDTYPWGKINAAAIIPGLTWMDATDNFMNSIQKSIAGAFDSITNFK